MPFSPTLKCALPVVHLCSYALQRGTVNMSTVNIALLRLYRKYVETGVLDGAKGAAAFAANGPHTVDTPAHRTLALEAAQQAAVLLQNNIPAGKTKALLPLTPGTKVAIIGPHSVSTTQLMSIYIGGNTVVLNQTMELGVKRAAAAHSVTVVGTELGCANYTGGTAKVRVSSLSLLLRLVLGVLALTLRPHAAYICSTALLSNNRGWTETRSHAQTRRTSAPQLRWQKQPTSFSSSSVLLRILARAEKRGKPRAPIGRTTSRCPVTKATLSLPSRRQTRTSC